MFGRATNWTPKPLIIVGSVFAFAAVVHLSVGIAGEIPAWETWSPLDKQTLIICACIVLFSGGSK